MAAILDNSDIEYFQLHRPSPVVCVCMCVCVCVCVGVCVFAHACLGTQPWLILCNSMNCSPPGFSVHGIFQARILEQVAISSSKGFPDPRIEPTYLSPPALADGFFTTAPPGKSSSVGQWFRSRILNSTAIKNAAIFFACGGAVFCSRRCLSVCLAPIPS